jgi:hypothetical protein
MRPSVIELTLLPRPQATFTAATVNGTASSRAGAFVEVDRAHDSGRIDLCDGERSDKTVTRTLKKAFRRLLARLE